MRTLDELYNDFLAVLAPLTRRRYTYTATATEITEVNASGYDVHEGTVGEAAVDGAGNALPYYVVSSGSLVGEHRRLAGGRSQATFSISVLVAGGSPRGVRDALSDLETALARVRLHTSTGLLSPYFDEIDIYEDPDADPKRWRTTARYSTTVH